MDIKSLGSPRAAFSVVGPSFKEIDVRISDAMHYASKWGDVETSFAAKHFLREWKSKLVDDVSSDADFETMRLFFEAENQCSKTNVRLNRWAKSPFANEIVRMRSWIARTLGKFQPGEVLHSASFGPGASTRVKRRNRDTCVKFTGMPHATHNCAVLAFNTIALSSAWRSSAASKLASGVELAEGNRITMVPKSTEKHRIIAIEPDMNMFFQKGIGGMIRRRLKAVGIDLDDQTHNQDLAREGSENGELATLDLSMASDTVAQSLVELLLPSDWVSALGMCRTQFGLLPGGTKHLYRKWSSMGNGYTFELESLIFSAVLYAICPSDLHRRRASVYGDDIISPSSEAELVSKLLSYLGFTLNKKKSFWSGSFRESCGKHYINGYDVTPFYVKHYDATLLSLFKIHNQLHRLRTRMSWADDAFLHQLDEILEWLRSYAPEAWQTPYLPDGFGDGAFIGDLPTILPSLKRRGPPKHKTWDVSFYAPSFVFKQRKRKDNLPVGAIPAALFELERARSRDDFHPSGGSFEPRSIHIDRGTVPSIKLIRIKISEVR